MNEIPPLRLLQVAVSLVIGVALFPIYPAVGATILIVLDTAAYGLRWVGAGSPVVAWTLLGALLGAIVGVGVGLARGGWPSGVRRALIAAGSLAAALMLLGVIYAHVMPPKASSGAARGGLSPLRSPYTVYTYNGRD